MARLLPSAWNSTSAYSVDDEVLYNGVVYKATAAISANSDGNTSPVGNTSWSVVFIVGIEDYYSLWESIQLAITVDDDEINNSIPLFIQTAEQGINKILRSPAQRVTRVYDLDDDSSFNIPGDLLNVYHMRINKSSSAVYTLKDAGNIKINAAADRQDFQTLKQLYDSTGGSAILTQYQYPMYWGDDTKYYVAPNYASGTEIELTYYRAVPSLGSTINLIRVVNGEEFAVNSDDQTLAEWVADGNAAADFVQATETVTKNLWTATVPHLLKLGALVAAEAYLKDSPMMQVWKQEYIQNLQETQHEFISYDVDRQHTLTTNSVYFGG